MSRVSIPFIQTSLKMSDNERSKLTGIEKDIHGQSSIRLKCLINNLASKVNTKYLEVGVYKGSTAISALFDNPKTKVTGIEHFLYDDREAQKWAPEGFIWDNMKSQLEANLERYRSHPEKMNRENFELIEGDFREVTLKDKYDLCYFDVSPVSPEIYQAFFDKILPSLTNECVVIFSQQSNSVQAQMLNDVFTDNDNRVEVLLKEYRISNSMSDSKKYYSGICIMGLKKKVLKTTPVKK